jgi:hypothetical protein
MANLEWAQRVLGGRGGVWQKGRGYPFFSQEKKNTFSVMLGTWVSLGAAQNSLLWSF